MVALVAVPFSSDPGSERWRVLQLGTVAAVPWSVRLMIPGMVWAWIRHQGFGNRGGVICHILRTFSENCFDKILTKICQKFDKNLSKNCQKFDKNLSNQRPQTRIK